MAILMSTEMESREKYVVSPSVKCQSEKLCNYAHSKSGKARQLV